MSINSMQDFLDLVQRQVPESLGNVPINLEDNDIGVHGVKHIADALASGKSPEHLSINLGANFIGDDGAKHIADALISTRMPVGLKLTLDEKGNNYIEKMLVEKVEESSAAKDLEAVEKGLNALVALNGLFLNDKRWNENPAVVLYAKYFELKLRDIISDSSIENKESVLSTLFQEFYDTSQALGSPKTYHWQSILQQFAREFGKLPAANAELENSRMFRFKELGGGDSPGEEEPPLAVSSKDRDPKPHDFKS